ncbi:hypothetical protein KC717_06220 [Candidatus Dojkabacteria bacterium]|uniref:Terminase large subunit gp17-like C-terminal domain-containing protein n=1 Tax=Candidatus Dojkabacteria bacterium TaxID=2099670 RepID=A0A955L906_9BACT|nr:hypothetical protein [Candidatus Dojkabacteria bacterium]
MRRAKAQKDIYWFARYYFRKYFQYDTPDIHREWINLYSNESRIAIACPRGHAKSTWFSLIFVLHAILFEKKRFIILLSDTQKQAEAFLGQIIEELETNESIIKDFGRVAGYVPPLASDKKKWTMSDIVTITDIRVMAFGFGAKLRGLKHHQYRPDLIVLDDVENDQSVRTKEQRDKYKSTFRKSILNLGDEETQIVVIGTILHFDSLLNDIISNPPPGYVTKLYKAIEDGAPLWGSRWTIESLELKKKEIGSIAFEQEYMNNPMSDGERIFIPQKWHEGVDFKKMKVFGYLDLAISEKETADYTAIVPIAKDNNGLLYQLPGEQIRGDIHAQLELVFKLHEKYKFASLGIEDVAYQKAFYQVLTRESAKRNIYDLKARPIKVDKDKIRRAVDVQHLVENGTIHFYKNDFVFQDQLMTFPLGAHDDLVDSFVGGIKLSQTGSYKFISNY